MEAIDEVNSEDVKQEQPSFKSSFKDDFNILSNETKKEINRLDGKITETKVDIIRWMLAFWCGQIAIIAGLLMYFLRK